MQFDVAIDLFKQMCCCYWPLAPCSCRLLQLLAACSCRLSAAAACFHCCSRSPPFSLVAFCCLRPAAANACCCCSRGRLLRSSGATCCSCFSCRMVFCFFPPLVVHLFTCSPSPLLLFIPSFWFKKPFSLKFVVFNFVLCRHGLFLVHRPVILW